MLEEAIEVTAWTHSYLSSPECYNSSDVQMLTKLEQLIQYCCNLREQLSEELHNSCQASCQEEREISSVRKGRPRIIIDEEQICYLRATGMTWKRVALLLGVST